MNRNPNIWRIRINSSAYSAKTLQDQITNYLEEFTASSGHHNILAHRMREAAKSIEDAIWSLEDCVRHFVELAKEEKAERQKGGSQDSRRA